MKKCTLLSLIVCLCLFLAACGSSGAAQASTPADASASAAPAAVVTAAPAPASTPKPVDLKPIVKELNLVEQDQQEKEYPFTGVYELDPNDSRTIIYKVALDNFGFIALGADLEIEEFVDNYNKTLDELPAMAIALEDFVHVDAPDAHIKLMLMLEKTSDQIVAVIYDGQIVYDAINGVGEKPAPVTPIMEPEETPEASPAA